MLATILTLGSYLIAFLGLIDLPDDIKRWRAAIKVYGGVPWRLIRQMINMTLKSQKSYEFNNLFMVIFLISIAEAKHIVEGFEYQRIQGIIALLFILQRILRYLVPPSVIFLASSDPASTEPLVSLTHGLKPQRVVTLIGHYQHVFVMDWAEIFPGNLRTKNIMEWRSFVHYLTDVVPITIIDTRIIGPSIVEETERQMKRNLLTRTIFLVCPDNSAPVLEASGYPADPSRLQVEKIETLANASKRLLNSPIINEPRAAWRALSFQYQKVYDAMNRSVPRKFQRPQFVNAMLIKAVYVMDYAHKIFIGAYKDCTMEGLQGRLAEDIPSKKAPGEELEWLKNSRELDEAENIYISALELAEKSPGYNQKFNIANANNKLGKLARYRREWNKAIEYLNNAIMLFEAQRREISTMRVTSELADAHYLLGEVHMARYRETGTQPDREACQNNFMASIALDQELERDPSATSSIMSTL